MKVGSGDAVKTLVTVRVKGPHGELEALSCQAIVGE